MAGLPAALAATAGIFLPSFSLFAFLNPLIPNLRKSKVMAAFLDTVNVIAVASILVICIEMGKAAITDWKTVLLALAGFVITMRFKKLNTAFVVSCGLPSLVDLAKINCA